MKNLISISEIVERVESEAGSMDILAWADAAYDESHGLVEMNLGCNAVRGDVRPGSPPKPPCWLPRPAVLREAVPIGDAVEEARLIFAHWVKQVRHAIPCTVNA